MSNGSSKGSSKGAGGVASARCEACNAHIGWGPQRRCGACAEPAALRFVDLLRFGRLVKRFWAGTPRELWRSALHQDYRPAVCVKLPAWAVRSSDRRMMSAELADAAEFANLFDRLLRSRGLQQRACRV